MLRATFVMEQHIGHRTFYLNLRRFVDAAPLRARWVEVTYVEPGGAWERLPLPRPLRVALRGRAKVRDALATPADVLFFNTQVPAVVGAGLRLRRPYVVSTDITPAQYDRMAALYGHRPDRPGPLRLAKRLANRAVLRGAAWLLPWSTWARDSLVRDYGVDPARVEVLPPGVDTDAWCPAPAGSADGPVRLLFVGGDFWRKGGATLLDAFRALPQGSAELLVVTRSEVAEAPGVRVFRDMRANTPELIALYRGADAFVLPSGAEAFGIAAVEASAAGLPVVASSVGGLADIVADGETGFLVPPGDAGVLADRLRLLGADAGRRARMGAAARARAEARFDARRNAARLVALLEDAADHRGETACDHVTA